MLNKSVYIAIILVLLIAGLLGGIFILTKKQSQGSLIIPRSEFFEYLRQMKKELKTLPLNDQLIESFQQNPEYLSVFGGNPPIPFPTYNKTSKDAAREELRAFLTSLVGDIERKADAPEYYNLTAVTLTRLVNFAMYLGAIANAPEVPNPEKKVFLKIIDLAERASYSVVNILPKENGFREQIRTSVNQVFGQEGMKNLKSLP